MMVACGQVRTGPRSGFTNRPERSILSSLCLMVLKCQCFMLTLVSSGFLLAPARPSPFSLPLGLAHTEVEDQYISVRLNVVKPGSNLLLTATQTCELVDTQAIGHPEFRVCTILSLLI